MALERLPHVRAIVAGAPVWLGGFCNGGLVAYHTATRLLQERTRVAGIVLVDAAISTARYRFVGALTQRFADRRHLGDRARRDLFLAWRDRQATVEHLLGLASDSVHRFTTVRERLNFVAAGVGRKLGSIGRRRFARSAVQVPTSDTSADERLWQAYIQAIAAYVPPRSAVPVLLIASDELPRNAEQEWRAVSSDLRVIRVSGDHLTCVTTALPRVANAVADFMQQTAAESTDSVRVA